MNILTHKPSTQESAAIRNRIFNVLPAASYQMEKLFGLLDIELADSIPTACVECRVTPRLMLNPRFIEEYCSSDANLFLLILHELHHVILGHTRLFPRGNLIDNILFDAVINSMLARTVGKSAGVELFTRTNSFDSFPSRLLRPPPGWPGSFEAALVGLPVKEVQAIRLLYGEEEGAVTYHDIYEALKSSLGIFDLSDFVLLGNHGEDEMENPLLSGIVRGIVEGWPPPPFRISGRDEGKHPATYFLEKEERPGVDFQNGFKQVLRKCGIWAGRGPAVYQSKKSLCAQLIETVVPDARDRRVTALRSLTGQSPLIYRSEITQNRLRPLRVPIVHLYLDVSGSMDKCLPYLTAVCKEPFRRGELKIFAFSTVVSEVSGTDLSKVPISNSGGTDINCVLNHVTQIPKVRRPRVILLATDGYVGKASQKLIGELGKIRVVVAMTDPPFIEHLKPWVDEIIQLPKP